MGIYIYGVVCVRFRCQQMWVLIWLCLGLVVFFSWAKPSSEPQFPHCAKRSLDWISGPHKSALGVMGRLSRWDSHPSISPHFTATLHLSLLDL